MKKNLLLGAFLAFAGIASAQTLSITVDGQAVENGGTFTSTAVHIDEGEPGDDYYFSIQLAPKVELTASSDVKATVEFTPTKVEIGNGLQMCWPQNCQMASVGKTISSSNDLVAGVAQNLMIDSFWADVEKDKKYTCEATVKAYVTNSPADSFEFTLVMVYDGTPDAVDGIEADSNAPAVYYNLQGVQVENPGQGIYIVKRGSKTYKQVIR